MMGKMFPEMYPADSADASLDAAPPTAGRPAPLPHILETDGVLADWLVQQGQPAWRARAIRRWLFERRAASFADMTDLSKDLRSRLEAIARHSKADDGTEKLLLALHDGQRIECVLLRDGDRRTVCISSQVGCAMGCVFCASGLDGVIRNLTTGEILEQLLRLQQLLPATSGSATSW